MKSPIIPYQILDQYESASEEQVKKWAVEFGYKNDNGSNLHGFNNMMLRKYGLRRREPQLVGACPLLNKHGFGAGGMTAHYSQNTERVQLHVKLCTEHCPTLECILNIPVTDHQTIAEYTRLLNEVEVEQTLGNPLR